MGKNTVASVDGECPASIRTEQTAAAAAPQSNKLGKKARYTAPRKKDKFNTERNSGKGNTRTIRGGKEEERTTQRMNKIDEGSRKVFGRRVIEEKISLLESRQRSHQRGSASSSFLRSPSTVPLATAYTHVYRPFALQLRESHAHV